MHFMHVFVKVKKNTLKGCFKILYVKFHLQVVHLFYQREQRKAPGFRHGDEFAFLEV